MMENRVRRINTNSDGNETRIDIPHLTAESQSSIDKLPSNSSSELNLTNLRRSIMQSLQSSAALPHSEPEDNLNLKNDFDAELVEVVEMKIYRFNPPPALEERQSSRIKGLENESVSVVNSLGDDSNCESTEQQLIRELEMHSYSKPASAEITNPPVIHHDPYKRLKAPRYFGDLTEDDYLTPMRAKHAWYIARTSIQKKNEKILRVEAENEALERRLKNLKQVIRQLRLNGSIPLKFRKKCQVSSAASEDDHEIIVVE